MNRNALLSILAATTFFLGACASAPDKQAGDAAKPEPKWDVASEPEVAAALDKAVEDATKGWVKLKKDGVLMFCKRARQIGSNLPTITCLTEEEVRIQVQNMQKYRDDMRQRSGKCPMGGNGCRSGG